MDFINELCQNGAIIYIVGGAVRDIAFNLIELKNKEIKDIDLLVTQIDIHEVEKILLSHGSIVEVGKNFGVIIFKWSYNSVVYDIALPRTEISTGVSHRSFSINYDKNISIEEDFKRRDATINAMGIKIKNCVELLSFNTIFDLNSIFDPYRGIDDIKLKIWKCVGNPKERFEEDPIRIFRAYRQCAELNLQLDLRTRFAIKENSHIIKQMLPNSYVRIFNEFLRMLKSENYIMYVKQMIDDSIIQFISIDENIPILPICYEMNEMNEMDKIIGFNGVQHPVILLKFCLLIEPELHNPASLYKKLMNLQLSATSYLTHSNIKTIQLISLFFKDINNDMTTYDILFLMSKMFTYIKIRPVIKSSITILLTYAIIKKRCEKKILDNFKECDGKIYSIEELDISGKMIAEIMKITGREIGEIKQKILLMVMKKEIDNDNLKIIEFLKRSWS